MKSRSMCAAVIAAAMLAGAAEARTTEEKIRVPPIPGGLHHAPMAMALNAIIHNTADNLSQAQRNAARQTEWDKAKAKFDQKLTESTIMNANRDARYSTAQTHWRDNLRPIARTSEYMALSMMATAAHTMVLDPYESKKQNTFEGAAATALDASTPVNGLEEAIAEACNAGCVSREEAERFSNGGIACHSDPDVGGSWTDPGKLRKLIETEGCIDAAPSSKASKCEAAFAHMMNLMSDYPTGYRLKQAGDTGIKDAISTMLKKTSAQQVTQCKMMETRQYKCLPKSAVSNPKSYDDKTKAAKKFGVDCAKKAGNLPSQNCDRAQTAALMKGAATQVPAEGNINGREIGNQMINLAGANQSGRNAAMDANAAQPCDPSAVKSHFNDISAFLDLPEIRTYMASPQFFDSIRNRIARLPEKHRQIDLAMHDFERNVLHAMYHEPDMGEIAIALMDEQRDEERKLAEERRREAVPDMSLAEFFAHSGVAIQLQDPNGTQAARAGSGAGRSGEVRAIPIAAARAE